jgi:chromosome partitioning protein
MRRIALVNLKGGAGKSTTATALAVGLARRGHRTLLIDTDPSGNASWTVLGGQGAEGPTLAAVLTRHAAADEAIRPTPTRGLDLLPADSDLGGVNVALAQELGRDTRLRSALAALEGRYDVVLLDTGPQLTTLLVNALVAAEEVIVPLDAGVYAVLGLVELERVIAEVSEAYNPGLRLAGLVLTKVQRNNVSRDVEAELRARYGPLVFNATIPLSAKVEESHSRGLTVVDFAPKSAPALAYTELVTEVINNGGREAKRGGVQAGGFAGKTGAA